MFASILLRFQILNLRCVSYQSMVKTKWVNSCFLKEMVFDLELPLQSFLINVSTMLLKVKALGREMSYLGIVYLHQIMCIWSCVLRPLLSIVSFTELQKGFLGRKLHGA